MDKETNNSVRTWLTVIAVIIGIGAVLYTLFRMEKRLRRAYGRVEQWLNTQSKPITIELDEE